MKPKWTYSLSSNKLCFSLSYLNINLNFKRVLKNISLFICSWRVKKQATLNGKKWKEIANGKWWGRWAKRNKATKHNKIVAWQSLNARLAWFPVSIDVSILSLCVCVCVYSSAAFLLLSSPFWAKSKRKHPSRSRPSPVWVPEFGLIHIKPSLTALVRAKLIR